MLQLNKQIALADEKVGDLAKAGAVYDGAEFVEQIATDAAYV